MSYWVTILGKQNSLYFNLMFKTNIKYIWCLKLKLKVDTTLAYAF